MSWVCGKNHTGFTLCMRPRILRKLRKPLDPDKCPSSHVGIWAYLGGPSKAKPFPTPSWAFLLLIGVPRGGEYLEPYFLPFWLCKCDTSSPFPAKWVDED